MKVTFYGAVQTTTGSMHGVDLDGTRVLLDCGLVQGKRKESFERNRHLPLEPADVDKVLLSHAHIDHSGNLPTLVNRGFRGEILGTPPTQDLCDFMLRDSAHLQEKDVEYVNKKRLRQGKRPFELLYTADDVDRVMRLFRRVPYGQPVPIAPGASATFYDAGHILGSALVAIDAGGRRLLFTGDLGRPDTPILRDPVVVHDVDWLITESTYGNRVHPPKADVQGRLKAFVEDIHMQRAKLVIPSFSIGRTQVIVYYLREIYQSGRIPPVPVFVDSPLSVRATEVYERHPECYDREATRLMMEGEEPFQFRGLTYITDAADSKRLNHMPGPMIIISASGMCEGGRIQHHLANTIHDPRNIVLIVGFQAEHTLGRRLVEHADTVRIFGEEFPLRARVHTINALSAHADREELLAYFRAMGRPVRRAFCVHGEPTQTAALAEALRQAGVHDVTVPFPGQSVNLD